MQVETELIICDILGKEMGLATNLIEITDSSSNFVTIYNQNYVMPRSDGLFVVVGFGFSKIISSNSGIKEDEGGNLIETQDTNEMQNIVINIMSQDASARQRKSEVVMALSSFYSQQQQEKYSFRIGKIPDAFLNVSDAEGSTTINRYTIIVPMQVWNHKEKSISEGFGSDYYDDFTGNVTIDENGGFNLKEIIPTTTEGE